MKPTVYRVFHYPALIVETAPTPDGFRHRFPSRALFKEFVVKMRRDGLATALRRLSDGVQDNYMWACSMIAHEIRELTEALQVRQAAERGQS